MSILEPTPYHALLWLDFKNQFDSGGARVIENKGQAYVAPQILPSPTVAAANFPLAIYGVTITNPTPDVLRIAYVNNAVTYSGGNYLVVGEYYQVSGECRGDGTNIPNLARNGSYANLGTSANTWQTFNEVFKTTLTSIYFGCQSMSNGGYVEFRNLSIKSWGPNNRKCIIGDGTTATTFPTKLIGQNVFSFDGLATTNSDFINTGIVNPFSLTSSFTFAVVVSNITQPVSGGSTLLATYYSTTDVGISFYLNILIPRCFLSIMDGGKTRNSSIPLTASSFKNINCFIATYNGSASYTGTKIYLNGELKTSVGSDIGTAPNILNGRPLYVGGCPNSAALASYNMSGNMHHASVFPFELSQSQVKSLHNRLMKSIKV